MVGTPESLRIVYFGTPEFAVPTLRALLDSTHTVCALVSQPDRPRGRGHKLVETPTKALARSHDTTVLQPTRIREDAFLASIAELQPDLGVVAAYGRILPDALLRIPRLGMINVHASLLPKYRGAAPIHRAVIAGEEETGVTIMRVVQALDAGPMLASTRRPIGPDETSVDVERDLAELGAHILLDVAAQLAAGRSVEVPQDETAATYAPKILKSEGAIDWSLPARQLHNLVRGLQPWPLVSATIGSVRCLIHRTEPTDERTTADVGTVVEATGPRLSIAAADGRILRILSIQPEGRRAMSARDFLAGHPVAAGTHVKS
jgi:methionyl-tRNA formyltransferase